jgi:alpha-L-fucosidase
MDLNKIQSWKDLKYGMFVHFGLYSLCGGVWNGEQIKRGYSEQILSQANIPQADYEALIKEFNVPEFSADKIAKLALDAGMKYIVMVSKHHDGFCLFDTNTTDYNSNNSSCKRDLVGEMAIACKKVGLKFGVYFSWIDWHCPDALPISDHNSDRITEKHMLLNINQITELLTNYGDICELWMDMGYPTKEQSLAIRRLAHSLQPNIMLNGRVWNDCGDFLTMGDNEYPTVKLSIPWQTPATIYHETWGYRSWQKKENADDKIKEITSSLYSVLNGGGNYLLNIGPDNNGAIVPFEAEILRGVGKNIKTKGLNRKTLEENIKVSNLNEKVKLRDGELAFRYTGSEYYTFHAIATSEQWYINVEEDCKYSITWTLPSNLIHEVKLCLEIDKKEIYFTLKKGYNKAIIVSSIELNKGLNKISIHTCGDPLNRPELKLQRIELEIKRN